MTKIGDYNVVKELGRGRITIVYHVKDDQGKDYALKLLMPIAEKDGSVQLLKREERISSKLFHPSIARVLKYELLPFGPAKYHCLIMEYVEGEDLGKRLEKGPVSIAEAIRIAWCICTALEYAHENKVVHRDLKPQNILIEEGSEKVKITDFGLASAASNSIASLTSVVGTPFYLSPEQAKGEKGGKYSDLYSLGVIMYQMITGTVPFKADHEAVILQMHRETSPIPISHYCPKVPKQLEALVNKAMEKWEGDRFSSATAMRRALEDIAMAEQVDLHSKPRQPISKIIWKMFFDWPAQRWEDLITNLGASAVWVILAFLVGSLTLLLFGTTNGNGTNIADTSTTQPTNTFSAPNIVFTATTQNDLGVKTVTPTEPFPTSTSTPSATPTIPPGFSVLAQLTRGGWIPGDSDVELVENTRYKYDNERIDNNCRISVLTQGSSDIAKPWVNCQAIGEPTPTIAPTPRPAPTPSPQPSVAVLQPTQRPAIPTTRPNLVPTKSPSTPQPARPPQPTSIPLPNLDGVWQGSISVGGNIQITITNRRITRVNFDYAPTSAPSLEGECGSTSPIFEWGSTITDLRIPIQADGTFASGTISVIYGNTVRQLRINGTINSSGNSFGQLEEVFANFPVDGCTQRATFNWNVTQ